MDTTIVTNESRYTKLKSSKIGGLNQGKGIFMDTRYKTIEKEIEHFANTLVTDNAKWDGDTYSVDWDKIDTDHQNMLIALMVDRDGKDFLAIGENDEKYRDDILSHLTGMIQAGDMESENRFAECVKKAVRHYYEGQAIELIDELTGYYTHETLADQGLRLVQDPEHGDFVVRTI